MGTRILIGILSILFITLAAFSYFSNPKKGKGSGCCLGFLGICFVELMIVLLSEKLCLTHFYNKGYGDPYIGLFFLNVFCLFIPCFIIAAINFEGFIVAFIRFKYVFKGKSSREYIMSRERQREHETKGKDYKKKINDIENQETKIEHKLVNLAKKSPEIVPEIIEYIPKDTYLYKGYFAEIERRFEEGQIKKTVVATRERIKEGKMLWDELAGLHRAKADVKRAWSEFSMVETEINTKEKRIEAEHERVDLESDVKRLELESRKLELEKEIKNIEQETKLVEKKGEGPSPEDRLLQSVRDNLEIMKAKGIAGKEIEDQRDQTLKDIDEQKNSEFYKKINNMYNDLLIEIMEKTKN